MYYKKLIEILKKEKELGILDIHLTKTEDGKYTTVVMKTEALYWVIIIEKTSLYYYKMKFIEPYQSTTLSKVHDVTDNDGMLTVEESIVLELFVELEDIFGIPLTI